MMDCRELEELLPAYAEGSLPTALAKRIEEALPHCPGAGEQLEQYRVLAGLMADAPSVTPPTSLKEGFQAMLAQELAAAEGTVPLVPQGQERSVQPSIPQGRGNRGPFGWIQLVAATVILLLGVGLGTQVNMNSGGGDLAALREEMDEMKKLMILDKLQLNSPADRLQAVSNTQELTGPNQEVLLALIYTMDTDPSVNVRLASARALARFEQEPLVRQALVRSLPRQTDPLMQMTLIELLTTLQEKGAVNTLRELSQDSSALDLVRQKAEQAMGVLI